jgi:phosphoserine phosphatase
VRQWLRDEAIDIEGSTIRFVSDSFADAPLLDLVDEPIFATASARAARRARLRGWRVVDLSR